MIIHRPQADRALEKQIARWREVENRRQPTREIDLNVVTFSRQTGSGGKLIAARVAQCLDLPFFNREIIQMIADSADIDANVIESLDEKGWSSNDSWLLEGPAEHHDLLDGTLRQFDMPPQQYKKHLTLVMQSIAAGEGGVVLGRGAGFILPRDKALRVRIVAPLDIRIDYIRSMFDVSDEQARKIVRQGDKDRATFTREYFGANIDDAEHYDVVLNMDLYSLEAAVIMVLQAWGAARSIWSEDL